MYILIDSQKSVEVEPVWRRNEEGDAVLTLEFGDANAVLEAWRDLSVGSRNFRYGNAESDDSPSTIIIAWATSDGVLCMSDLDPHWDGVGDCNAYVLSDLASSLPVLMLRWGRSIGENDVPPLPAWAS